MIPRSLLIAVGVFMAMAGSTLAQSGVPGDQNPQLPIEISDDLSELPPPDCGELDLAAWFAMLGLGGAALTGRFVPRGARRR